MKKYHNPIVYFVFLIIMLFINFFVISIGRYVIDSVFQEEDPQSAGAVIVWHDRGLEAAIKREMGVSIEKDVRISFANEWPGSLGAHRLTLEGADIQNLEDFKYFTNLRGLVLKDTDIQDLSPLLFLKELDTLEIYGGNIKDLDVIGQMENLDSLVLYDIPISSIQPLEKMHNLWKLGLGGLPINDISVLASMRKLYWITLERLPLTDVSALEYLPGLFELEIIDTPVIKIPLLSESLELLTLKNTNVTDISEIPGSIRVLKAWGNQIKDFTPLSSLPNLTTLYITDVDLSGQSSPLSLQKLEVLSLRNCNLPNISFLGNCTKLDALALENNELENIDGINSFSSLNTLILSNNRLQRIDGVESIPYLEWLDVSENPELDLKPLADIHSLKRLDLSGIDLKDIQLDKLLNLPVLEALLLNDCGLNDIKFMKKFQSVHGLHVSNNHISDISEIANMNASRKINEVVLDLSYNPITDLTPLANCEKISNLNLSGIDLKNAKGLESLGNIYILNLTMEECNLDSLSSIKVLSEIKSGIVTLSLSNNQLKELSLMIDDKWSFAELDISENFITDEYLEQIGASKISSGQYWYGRHMRIKLYN